MFKPLVLSLALAGMAAAAQASEFDAALENYLRTEVAQWMQDPVILDALRAANAMTSGYDQAQIDAMDQAWRAEVGTASTPTISPVLENAASDFLRTQVGQSDGMILEVFVMDAVGLNVASSDVTSDMWQGDEDKWQQTYAVGPDAIHISEIEFDDSAQAYIGQVSVTITDPATGESLGAITVGVNAEALL